MSCAFHLLRTATLTSYTPEFCTFISDSIVALMCLSRVQSINLQLDRTQTYLCLQALHLCAYCSGTFCLRRVILRTLCFSLIYYSMLIALQCAVRSNDCVCATMTLLHFKLWDLTYFLGAILTLCFFKALLQSSVHLMYCSMQFSRLSAAFSFGPQSFLTPLVDDTVFWL